MAEGRDAAVAVLLPGTEPALAPGPGRGDREQPQGTPACHGQRPECDRKHLQSGKIKDFIGHDCSVVSGGV